MPVTTPNMNLIAPTVGVTPSPDWALNVNSDLNTLDGHDHTPGKGVQITPPALDISSFLSFKGNDAIDLRTTRYVPTDLGTLTGTDIDCIVVDPSGDLYYVNTTGYTVQIVSGNAIVGTPGSIANLASPASASYVSASGTFVWQANTGVAANMDAGTLILRYPGSYPTPSGAYIAFEAPASIPTSYAILLPSTLPSVRSILTLDSSGNLADTLVPDGTTTAISGNSLKVATNPAFQGNASTTGSFTAGTTIRLGGGSGPLLTDVSGNIVSASFASGGNTQTASSPTISSGTYTPTYVSSSGLSGRNFYQAQWCRMGNYVQVSGKVDMTANAANTTLSWTVPINSALGASGSGTACGTIVGGILPGSVQNDGNNVVVATLTNVGSFGDTGFFYTYGYFVI